MGELFRLLVTEMDWPLKKIAFNAYDTKLGPHHNWVLRKLVGVGLNACTSRENFIKSYIKEKNSLNIEITEEEVYKECKEIYILCEKLA